MEKLQMEEIPKDAIPVTKTSLTSVRVKQRRVKPTQTQEKASWVDGNMQSTRTKR
jgi:hypothetical protein